MTKDIIPVEQIAQTINLVRGQKVLLDSDLAELYGVTTGNLKQAVKRNRDRFPGDFMFQLTAEEQHFEIPIWNIKVVAAGRAIVLTLSPSKASRCSRAS